MNEKIKELLESKKNNLKEEEKEEFMLVNSMLCNQNWYKMVDPDTAVSILSFLGIKDEDLEKTYISLLSQKDDSKFDSYELIDRSKLWLS